MIGNGGRPGDPGPGSETINKWGENADIDVADAAAGQVIWPIKSTVQQYFFLDAAITMTMQSDDPNDTLLGSGAKSIKVCYHDSDGEEVVQIFELDGVGAVNIPLNFGVFRAEVATSGVSNTNEGQITFKNGANIYATIEIGEGQTQIAVTRCPNNKKGIIKGHETGYGRTGGNNEASMRLRVRKIDGTIITKWDPIISVDHPKDVKLYGIGGLELSAGEFAYWECVETSAADTPVRGAIDVRYEDK